MKLQVFEPQRKQASVRKLAGRTVVVVSGGQSSEREISLRSGSEMLRALQAQQGELAEVLSVQIEMDGQWLLGSHSCTPEAALAKLPVDAIFLLALHGGDGENGAIQALFEQADRAYTGSGVTASALCMDKHATNARLVADGLRCAPGLLVRAEPWRDDRRGLLAQLQSMSNSGWFVKPNGGGSSVATTAVQRDGDLAPAIEAALATGDSALVEARIEGVECSCGVLGNLGEVLIALPPIEIRPHAGRFFDYDEKYSEAGAYEVCPPELIGSEVCDHVRQLALRAHELTGCDGYSRSDFIVPESGEPVFLEINTLPGFTARSLFPKEARAIGIEFPELLHEILALALERFERGS